MSDNIFDDDVVKALFADEHEAQQRRKQVDKHNEQQLMLDLENVMNTRSGKNVLFHLIESTGALGSHFTGNSTTFYRLGRAEVGRELLGMMTRVRVTAFAEIIEARQKKTTEQEKDDDR